MIQLKQRRQTGKTIEFAHQLHNILIERDSITLVCRDIERTSNDFERITRKKLNYNDEGGGYEVWLDT